MGCPFLREAEVRYCHAASVRKLIRGAQPDVSGERCSSREFRTCELARERLGSEVEESERCPFLHDALARYCEAAPSLRFVPYSDACGRCSTAGYRYCETWLRISRAGAPAASTQALTERLCAVPGLLYAPNHMWLDLDPSGSCYVGIDALLADVLGRAERISFVTSSGFQRPSAVVTARGIDWPLVFPRPLRITGANIYMRHAPDRLTLDPYGIGWLFEGIATPEDVREGLIDADEAPAWMAKELERITEFVHAAPGAVQSDGGAPVSGFAAQLSREDLLRLLNDFFAPHLTLTRTDR